jgi:metal-responsive CopG/Arc/MetJ family transcriptional regulator
MVTFNISISDYVYDKVVDLFGSEKIKKNRSKCIEELIVKGLETNNQKKGVAESDELI